ncbi:MAG TPA: TIGR03364 family FAD-dependent oxidoreductase [Galbitalea sp.]|jgi:FAD dependent oxidoreductase TIGR03364|nr:TIGR03364 family FAD-dependent oxidoreductase [Galbitalea sp.]
MTAVPIAESDVLIVGAGIVGLAHAAAAHSRGLTVTVIDRDARAVGASVRNFGHCCVTAQSGELHDLALVAREKWLENSERAGFFSVRSGALAVARSATELAVLEELSESREPGEVELLTPHDVKAQLGTSHEGGILGGARLRDDLRVDPREASRSLARWLGAQKGVTFLWQTSYQGPDGADARTSRGPIRAARTIVCVGHDLDYLFPDLAAEAEIERCALQMTRVDAPKGLVLGPAVLTGTSMLRYPAFTETGAAAALKTELGSDRPELLEIGANVMFTQRPNGTLIVGDSHRYAATMDPFNAEKVSRILLEEIAGILGVKELKVKERWQGIYASSGRQPFLIEEPAPGVTVAIVTSGVGMTISFGLAERTFAGLS